MLSDVETWCTTSLLAGSSMYVSNDCMLMSHTGVMVYLCNLNTRVLKLKDIGPGWDDSWQEAAQGTLLVIIS